MKLPRSETPTAPRAPLAVSIVLVVCGAALPTLSAPPESTPASGASPVAEIRAASPRQVNPFTGADLALERKQAELERARLDEQIAASELNRRKYQFEMQRLGSLTEASLAGAPSALAPATHAFDGAAYRGPVIGAPTAGDPRQSSDTAGKPGIPPVSGVTLSNRGNTGSTPESVPSPTGRRESARRKAAAVAAKPAVPAVELLAVVTTETGQRALIASEGKIVRASRGDMAFGRRVDAIDARSVSLDGQVYSMREQPATLGRTDARTEPNGAVATAPRPAIVRETFIDLNPVRSRGLSDGIEPPIPAATR